MQEALREHYGLALSGQAHRALADCRTLAHLLPHLLQHLRLERVADCAALKSCMGLWRELSCRLPALAPEVSMRPLHRQSILQRSCLWTSWMTLDMSSHMQWLAVVTSRAAAGMSQTKPDPVNKHRQGQYGHLDSKAQRGPKAGKTSTKAGKAAEPPARSAQPAPSPDQAAPGLRVSQPRQPAPPAELPLEADLGRLQLDDPQPSYVRPSSSSSSAPKPGRHAAAAATAAQPVQPPQAPGNLLQEVAPAAWQAQESWKAALQQQGEQGHHIAQPLASLDIKGQKQSLKCVPGVLTWWPCAGWLLSRSAC